MSHQMRENPPEGSDCFYIWHVESGLPVVQRAHGRQLAEQCVAEYDRRENDALAAIRRGGGVELCRVGWHRLFHDKEPFFFKYTSGKAGVRARFRFGPQPFQHTTTWIEGHGKDAKPWQCVLCGQWVGPEN